MSFEIQRYTIDVHADAINYLRLRLEWTRWPDEIIASGWVNGTDLSYLRKLVKYWLEGFDWLTQEARLNRLSHYQAVIDGERIHFLREGSEGSFALPESGRSRPAATGRKQAPETAPETWVTARF
jgi:hypothetical protein